MEENKLYVGNLNYSVEMNELSELFGGYGPVKDVKIIEGRGFGFVEMESSEDANKVKDELNNTEFKGRNLKINFARPKQNNNSRRY